MLAAVQSACRRFVPGDGARGIFGSVERDQAAVAPQHVHHVAAQ